MYVNIIGFFTRGKGPQKKSENNISNKKENT